MPSVGNGCILSKTQGRQAKRTPGAAPLLQIEAKKAFSPLETRFFPISIGLPVGKRYLRW